MTKLLYLALIAATAGCLGTEDETAPDEGTVESESVPLPGQGSIGQGSTMQGSTMQGSTMQGSTMQGSTMQGSTMQGGSTGTMSAQYGEIRGTALVFWTKSSPKSLTWEQRFPDQICYWNQTRTIRTSCTKTPVGAPIVGSTWPTTFRRVEPDGTVTQIPVTLRLEAVRRDTTTAMHRLNGSSYANGAFVPRGTNNCENPYGCKVNSDIYNYDLRAINVVDSSGQNPWLCPAGQTAIALSGTWDATGTYVPSTNGSFTFACTNGVIAKCTRWGYRHYDAMTKDNGPGYPESTAAYHQTCIRAAMADYCGSAKSMTKDGTMVDIYDYASWNDSGYVPKLRGLVYDWYAVNAFSWEADYDRYGATRIDYQRYAELASNPDYNLSSSCPGRFWDASQGENFANWIRQTSVRAPTPPYIMVDSVPACGHGEYVAGKWLSSACSDCTRYVGGYCTNPADPRGWDQGCVDWVKANDDYPWQVCYDAVDRMSVHSECTQGSALSFYDSGCTMTVCTANSACCNASSTWGAACVDTANSLCKGGRENPSLGRGYCGWMLGLGGGGGGGVVLGGAVLSP